MRRSVKNYLCILALAALVYFTGMTYLRAEENRTRELRATREETVQFSTGWYLLTGLEGFLILFDIYYLIASKGNEKTWKETMGSTGNKVGLPVTAFAGGLCGMGVSIGLLGPMPEVILTNTETPPVADAQEVQQEEEPYSFPVPELPPVMEVYNHTDEASGLTTISDAQDIHSSSSCGEPGVSTILTKEGGQATLVTSTFEKTGDAPDPAAALAYGLNADVFVSGSSSVNLMGSVLNTAANGAPGLAVNGPGAMASLSDSTISTQNDSSPALMSLFQADVTSSNARLTTNGNGSPAISTSNNAHAGLSGGSLTTYGLVSPLISGSASVELNSLAGTASNSPAAMLQAGGYLSMVGCTVTASGYSADGEEGFLQINGQSESSKQPKTYMNALSSTLVVSSNDIDGFPIPFIHVMAGDAEVRLSQNTIRIPSGLLIYQEGGNGTYYLDNQSAAGAIVASGGSQVILDVANGSSWSGFANQEQTPSDIRIHVDGTSTISLTGDLYITDFQDDLGDFSNVAFNGYMIYVNGNPIQ